MANSYELYKSYYDSLNSGNDTQEAATPVENNQANDYQPDPNNVFAAEDYSGSSEAYSDEKEKKKQEPQAEPETPAAPQNEAERTAAAQAQNANLYTAIGQDTQPDPVASMKQAGLDNDTISALQQIDYYAKNQSPEEFQKNFATLAAQNKNVADLYTQYYAKAAPQSNTPEQQPSPQNQILPSAGGNYQADKIYDPSKTYGRQPDGSYNYSYSAAQLQNDLAREGYYEGAIDGYFGQQTQEALDAYLKDNGKLASPSSTEANKDVPMSQAGSMSQAQQAAQNTTQQQNQNQNTNQANTFLEQIQRGWDRLWHGDNNSTPSAEPAQGSTASSSQPVPDYEPYSFNWFVDEYKAENPTATDEEARTFAGQQIVGIQNGDIPMPTGQVYGSPRYGGVEKPWNLTVDSMKSDLDRMKEEGNAGVQEGQFAKNDQQYALWHVLHPSGTLDDYYRIYPNRAPENQSASTESVARDSATDAEMARSEQMDARRAERERLEELRREAELNSIINGNNNLPENAPPMQVSNGNRQEQTLGDALSALTFRNGVQIPQALNGANRSSGLLSFIAPEASADEMEQIPAQATGEVYGTPRNSNDNYREELARLQQPQGEVYGSQRNGSVPERYIAPRQTLEYSDAFIRQEEMKDAYSPYADYSGSMASDDIQSSSGTASSDEQAMREAYEAAMQSAGRARDIFSGLETSEPEWIPVSEEVNTSQPIDVWAYNRAVADRQRGLNVDQILLAAEDEGSPQSMQYYNWIVNHLK